MAQRPDFVFVNKTAQSKSLTSSEGEERRQVFSRAHMLQPSTSGDFIVQTSTDMRVGSANESIRSRRVRRRHQGQAPDPSLDMHPFDPFQGSAVGLDRNMQAALMYYYTHVISSTFPISCAAAAARPHIMCYATEDPAVLYAILSLSHATIFSSRRIEKYARATEYFKQRTMVHLRKGLSQTGQVRASLAYAAAILLHLECVRGEIDAAKVHSRGLVSIMSVIEVPSTIPFPILNGIQACLYQCSAMVRTAPPLVVALDDHNHSLPAPEDTTPTVGCARAPESSPPDLAPQFAEEPFKTFIGEELSGVIFESAMLQRRRRRALSMEPDLMNREFEACHLVGLSIERKLLSMPFDVIMRAPRQNAIRLAIYITSGPRMSLLQTQNRFRTSLAEQLRGALQLADVPGLWKPCSQILLWVLSIAAHIMDHQEDRSWIASHVRAISRELGIISLSGLKYVLAGFGLDVVLFDQTLRGLWADVSAETQTAG